MTVHSILAAAAWATMGLGATAAWANDRDAAGTSNFDAVTRGGTVADGACTQNVQCHHDNNVCTCDVCVGNVCQHRLTIYGNTNCDVSALATIDDVLCTLNGFATFALCPNGDLKPDCTGDGVIDIDDIIGVTEAFGGTNPCACPVGIPCLTSADCDDDLFCNGSEVCVLGFCQPGADPCPGQLCSELGDVCLGGGQGLMTCALSSSSAPRGTSVTLEVFLESVSNLRGYQVALEITKLSGPGSLTVPCPDGAQIDATRPDYVFNGFPQVFAATDCQNARAAAAILAGGVNVQDEAANLAEFQLDVSLSSSFCTVYQIEILPTPDSRLRDPQDNAIPFVIGAACILQVTGDSGNDCNMNGTADECDPNDCQPNGIPDDCEIASGAPDCNMNGIPDACDPDCQPNGVPDVCDISGGTSLDCNMNGLPDECDPNDCQPNDVPDTCDIASGDSQDCNMNGTPDECDLAAGTAEDCQPNGRLDSCDIALGSSLDLNMNGTPDECEQPCAIPCTDHNTCTCDRCLGGFCIHSAVDYGDVNCTGDAANLDDILCVIQGFTNIADCRNGDLAPPCTGNDVIDLDDILKVLGAFGGMDPCTCP